MIIGLSTGSFPPITDGVTQVVCNYATWLNNDNDDAYVITPNVPGASYDYPYEVLTYQSFSVPTRKDYRMGIPALDGAFYRRAKAIPFDMIHAHAPFSSGQAALKLARRRDIPLIATFHSKFRDDFKEAVKSDFLADLMLKKVIRFFNQADDVWTVSESAIDIMREYGYRGDVYVMGNACDMEPGVRTRESDKLINDRYHIKEDTPVFMFVGQHVWQKNIKMIIKGLRVLKQEEPNFHMFFVGDGHKRKEAIAICQRYGLSENITFTGNIQEREVLRSLYLRSLAVILPSLYDMSSLVIKEAAAMHKPMVLVKGSTTAQGVEDQFNGFLVDNTPESLAATLQRAIIHPRLCEETGENAYKTLYRSWKDTVSLAKERYSTIIDRYHTSPSRAQRRQYAQYR